MGKACTPQITFGDLLQDPYNLDVVSLSQHWLNIGHSLASKDRTESEQNFEIAKDDPSL